MKMPSGSNHYTQWILELHGLEYSKMQRNDCYQTLQGSEKKSACATGLNVWRRELPFARNSTDIIVLAYYIY